MFAIEDKWKPQVDIYESDDQIIITAEIAGVAKEDLEIEIDDRAAKISGIRHADFSGKTVKYRLAEIQYGKFERTVYFPWPIDTENVSAVYQNGFLQLCLIKQNQQKFRAVEIED